MRLRAGAKAHGHKGYLEHDRIIGALEGTVARASSGATYLVFRPRLSEYALEMPRKSAIVYPKDVGIILVWADIYPGATVVESGLGSGSLTLALLRAVGPTGQVIVYEQRADMIPPALANIRGFALRGEDPDGEAGPSNLIVRERDVYEGIEETDVDQLVLDLPEPWRVLPHALDFLRPGGVVACYSRRSSRCSGRSRSWRRLAGSGRSSRWRCCTRPWHVKGQAVRPGPADGEPHGVPDVRAAAGSERAAARGGGAEDDEEALADQTEESPASDE